MRRQIQRPHDPNAADENQDDLTCPVCNLPVPTDQYNHHVDHCLINSDPVEDNADDDTIDIDTIENVETYTWAGHTRVRATSLVQGGLRGPGFVSITRSDEDQVLDIEGTEEEGGQEFGSMQYTESDLIVPQPQNETEVQELQTRSSIQEALTGQKTVQVNQETTQHQVLDARDKDDKLVIEELRQENDALRQKSMCNICMDSYTTPLVSTVCWHVSCEECWMRALGTKKLCPQCKVIIQPKDLRRIYL